MKRIATNSVLGSPPPGTYQLPSDFDIGNKRKTLKTKSGVYSFGAPHSVYKKVYLPHAASAAVDGSKVPGPGHYDVKMGTTGFQHPGSLTVTLKGTS